MNTKIKIVGVVALATAAMTFGASIQFDLGIGSTYAGTDAPAHASGALSGSEAVWNNAAGDVESGLFYSDGTVASGVSLDVGIGTSTIDWGSVAQNTGSAAGTGIYGTDLMQRWIWTKENNNLGVRVKGLAAGDYEVYVIVRESSALDRIYNVGVGVANTDNIGDLVNNPIANATGITTWSNGYNFVKTTVTVSGESDYVTIIIDPANAKYGTIQGLQIIGISEPTTLGMLTASRGEIPACVNAS